MPEFICNTSPLPYLHQLGHLGILPRLLSRVIVPESVVRELEIGRENGCDLPDPRALPWAEIRRPVSTPALPLASHLGPGESAVLALALESPDATDHPAPLCARRGAGGVKIPRDIGASDLIRALRVLGYERIRQDGARSMAS